VLQREREGERQQNKNPKASAARTSRYLVVLISETEGKRKRGTRRARNRA